MGISFKQLQKVTKGYLAEQIAKGEVVITDGAKHTPIYRIVPYAQNVELADPGKNITELEEKVKALTAEVGTLGTEKSGLQARLEDVGKGNEMLQEVIETGDRERFAVIATEWGFGDLLKPSEVEVVELKEPEAENKHVEQQAEQPKQKSIIEMINSLGREG